MKWLLIDTYSDTVIHFNINTKEDLMRLFVEIHSRYLTESSAPIHLMLIPLSRFTYSRYNLNENHPTCIVDWFQSLDEFYKE